MKEGKQTRTVVFEDKVVEYTLTRKKVKNINLTVKFNGEIMVSANKNQSIKHIETFLQSKSEFILYHTNRFEKMRKAALELPAFSHSQSVFSDVIRKIYPLFHELGVDYPVIKLKSMKSRWGSCMVSKKQIVLNTKLLNVPIPCMEYVVLHEFAHFIHPNHSKMFYALVEKLMPDYKIRKKELQNYAVLTM